jgi:hypothetical protein
MGVFWNDPFHDFAKCVHRSPGRWDLASLKQELGKPGQPSSHMNQISKTCKSKYMRWDLATCEPAQLIWTGPKSIVWEYFKIDEKDKSKHWDWNTAKITQFRFVLELPNSNLWRIQTSEKTCLIFYMWEEITKTNQKSHLQLLYIPSKTGELSRVKL